MEELLRKRDEKLQKKQNEATDIKLGGKRFASEEDKEIVRQMKNKKRDKRRERANEEDHFDNLFKKYKSSLLKKLDEQDETDKKGK